jgi:hypothetical protein
MLSLLLAVACFTPDAPELDVDTIPFENQWVKADDAVLRPLTIDGLLCPDGEPATVFAVYRTGLTEAAPVVVVFHSGAFDYVLNPDPLDPLSREHYRQDNRLSGEWSRTRVFETLGLVDSESGDPGEENNGALAAALVDSNTFALYPANCWGDLWHNEYGYYRNDGGEGFERNGRYLAWATTGITSKDPAESSKFRSNLGLGDNLEVPLDVSQVYMVGLGDGSRAIMELLWRGTNMPTVAGAIVDSPPDRMDWYVANQGDYPEVVSGLDRIYTDDLARVGNFSMEVYVRTKGFTYLLQNSLQLYYSSGDPSVPDNLVTPLAAQAATHPELTVVDTREAAHVQLNNNLTLARGAIDEMLGN